MTEKSTPTTAQPMTALRSSPCPTVAMVRDAIASGEDPHMVAALAA